MTRSRGFTLLEILIVLSLLGVLLVLCGSAFVAVNRALQMSQQRAERLDDLRATRRYLRNSLSQTLPLPVVDASGRRGAILEGEPERLSLSAPLPESLGGGLYRQQLFRDGTRLRVRFARFDGQHLEAWGEAQTLLDSVGELRLSYRGSDALGKRTGWLSQWPWAQRLPSALRVDLRLLDGERWVSEQVDLRLDLSAGVGSP